MTQDTITERLRTGCTLFLDTNAVWGMKLEGLTDDVNRWNALKTDGSAVSMCISPITYAERQAKERRMRGAAFDEQRVQAYLKSKTVDVPPLTLDDAERTSWWFHSIADTEEKWQNMKPRKAATADWFIAGHAVSREAIVVTDDNGTEFSNCERVKLAMLREALKLLLGAA